MIGLQALGLGIISRWWHSQPLWLQLFHAFSGVYGLRFSGMGLAQKRSTGQLTAPAVLLIPLALIVDQPWNLTMPISTFGGNHRFGRYSTSLAYIIYFRIFVSGA